MAAQETSLRSSPGRLSSARTFQLPVGERLGSGRQLGGYHIDFRVKAESPEWPPAFLGSRDEQLHVTTIQWGLGAYERYVAGEGERWLEAARATGRHLLQIQDRGGAWTHGHAMPHTYDLQPPWISAMAQGEGASLLARLHLVDGDDVWASAARAALDPMLIPAADGGTLAELDGEPFVEEYPTSPPSFVLNGAIFAVWGFHDVAEALGDDRVGAKFAELAGTLCDALPRYDLGYWSRYDLYPHPLPNVASSAYHLLHINQLTALQRQVENRGLAETTARWERYMAARLNRWRAFAAKAAFRLRVPRSRSALPSDE